MNYCYKTVRTTIVVEDRKENTYGVACSRGREVVSIIEDVSPVRAKVDGLVRLFNECELDVLHFEDAIEDSLE